MAQAVISAALLLGIAGCAAPSSLNPAGPEASDNATLFWIMTGIAAAVFVVVLGFLGWGLLTDGSAGRSSWMGDRFIIVLGAAIPAVILFVVLGFVLSTMVAESAPARPARLTVEVIGHEWWWQFRYLDPGAVVPGTSQFDTANEMHVPAGQPVQLRITSDDVIHGFRAPNLIAEYDAIPGRTNTAWLQADHTGRFRGLCSEYCGQEHANMQFFVVAQPKAAFARWLRDQSKPAAPLNTPGLLQGQEVFLGSACVYCHTIRGTDASGTIGPDLTHLASRRTIGAGVLPNTPGNLAGWILNSQSIKPGNKMPPMGMDARDLHALLQYLTSLK